MSPCQQKLAIHTQINRKYGPYIGNKVVNQNMSPKKPDGGY